MVHFWGCTITDFHNNLQTNWSDVRTALLDGSFLENAVVARSEPELVYGFESGKEMIIQPPEPFEESALGGSPRSRYPMVVVLFRNEDDLDEELRDADTVALFTVIHIRDSVCTMDTNLIFKLSKLVNGQVLNVQNLYASKGEKAQLAPCVVCESNIIDVVILPCRHMCVCFSCFKRVKNCPMCRSYIQKYFRLNQGAATSLGDECSDPVSGEGAGGGSGSGPSTSATSLLSNVSSKINRWLGIE
jgi:hypothetical protein